MIEYYKAVKQDRLGPYLPTLINHKSYIVFLFVFKKQTAKGYVV